MRNFRPTDEQSMLDFFYHLHDTLVLLGAHGNVAKLVEKPEAISASDVADLRQYNLKLIDATKMKLVNINKREVVIDK